MSMATCGQLILCASRVIVCWASAGPWGGIAWADDLTPRSALSNVRGALERVHSIEYRGDSTYSRIVNGEQRTDKTDFDFGYEGNSYYSTYHVEPPL